MLISESILFQLCIQQKNLLLSHKTPYLKRFTIYVQFHFIWLIAMQSVGSVHRSDLYYKKIAPHLSLFMFSRYNIEAKKKIRIQEAKIKITVILLMHVAACCISRQCNLD